MVDIEVLNVNVDLMVASFDDGGANEMTLGSNEVSRPTVGSISTPSSPTLFESIATPSTSNLEAKVAWELLKAQLSLNQKVGILHSGTSLSLHFFMVNDGTKPNPTFSQTIHCTICHYVSQAYSSSSITKKRKGLIT
jgi:hypothetical protein